MHAITSVTHPAFRRQPWKKSPMTHLFHEKEIRIAFLFWNHNINFGTNSKESGIVFINRRRVKPVVPALYNATEIEASDSRNEEILWRCYVYVSPRPARLLPPPKLFSRCAGLSFFSDKSLSMSPNPPFDFLVLFFFTTGQRPKVLFGMNAQSHRIRLF